MPQSPNSVGKTDYWNIILPEIATCSSKKYILKPQNKQEVELQLTKRQEGH